MVDHMGPRLENRGRQKTERAWPSGARRARPQPAGGLRRAAPPLRGKTSASWPRFLVEAKTEDTKSALERPLAANRAEKSPYPSFAQPEQRWLPGAACRACKIAIEAILQSYRVLRQKTRRYLSWESNNDTYHLRRFFEEACFFFFRPANLCRGFSSTASSSSSS